MVYVKAAEFAKRNMEGNPAFNSSNSFSVLSNKEIMFRASMMGVDIPLDNFDFIDVRKELELSREQISKKNEQCLDIHDSYGNVAPLCLSWHDTVVEEEKFTVVSGKKEKVSC
jgi:hypothetical protein